MTIRGRVTTNLMQSSTVEEPLKAKEEEDPNETPASPVGKESSVDEPVPVSSDEEEVVDDPKDADTQSQDDASKQLVLYDPTPNGSHEIVPVSDTIGQQSMVSVGNSVTRSAPRVL
ncbi:hypothetical protein AKJ16_DCAP24509, partial [Drosera capensis]